jgi:selenocysteine-specific elongation factor
LEFEGKMMEAAPQKHLILGTAGHVDHGKTVLVKALTGIDTDRLKEEKERGMTIDLGFAWLSLPSGVLLGIVDVPGHEKFLKNMLAGATGVDIALLVVAADEGVMPQTREHVQILDLLETKQGAVALTKIDLVEPDWLDLIETDLRRYLQSTFLRDAPIVRVSALTGEGIPALIEELDRLAQSTHPRPIDVPARMPIDRVFTITGFGTVVTGTLVAGTLVVGDLVEVMPQGIESRIRHIQVHGKPQKTAYAGSRVAVNLAGLEPTDISRGSVLAAPGSLVPSTVVDVSIFVLPDSSRPLTNRTRVRLHIGTAEVIGRAMVLGADRIECGTQGLAQLRLEKAIATARGDSFILRLYSPMELMGGGQVLVPNAQKHRRMDSIVIDQLKQIAAGSPEEIVLKAVSDSLFGLSFSDIVKKAGLSENQTTDVLQRLTASGQLKMADGKYSSSATYESLASQVKSILRDYHEANPMRSGAPKELLKSRIARSADQKDFQSLLTLMSREGEIVVTDQVIRLPDHSPKLTKEQATLAKEIENLYTSNRAQPPLASDIEQQYGTLGRRMLELLVEQGVLVKIAPEMLFHRDVLREIESVIIDYLKEHGQATVAEIRDLVGSSRKYVVPLLEYLDSKRITRRKGDQRVLAKG